MTDRKVEVKSAVKEITSSQANGLLKTGVVAMKGLSAPERAKRQELIEEMHGKKKVSNVQRLNQRIAELEEDVLQLQTERANCGKRCLKLEAQVEELDAKGVHTCHSNCQRPMCKLRRENQRLREKAQHVCNVSEKANSAGEVYIAILELQEALLEGE